jgi:hypothetical protein
VSKKHTVGLVSRHLDSRRDQKARDEFASALPDAEVGPFDADCGCFEVGIEADSQDEAIQRVRDAIAASGADDHLQVAEHRPPRLT